MERWKASTGWTGRGGLTVLALVVLAVLLGVRDGILSSRTARPLSPELSALLPIGQGVDGILRRSTITAAMLSQEEIIDLEYRAAIRGIDAATFEQLLGDPARAKAARPVADARDREAANIAISNARYREAERIKDEARYAQGATDQAAFAAWEKAHPLPPGGWDSWDKADKANYAERNRLEQLARCNGLRGGVCVDKPATASQWAP